MSTLADRYRYFRQHNPDAPATYAMMLARLERRYAEISDRLSEWTFPGGTYEFAESEFEVCGFRARVSLADDTLDWGDIEPSDEERENASAYVVALELLDPDGGEFFRDVIGGIDVIDLPGYVSRTWEDAAAYALAEHLLPEAEHYARTELRERAEWEARDTITV